jgi:hypothetical protein
MKERKWVEIFYAKPGGLELESTIGGHVLNSPNFADFFYF